ncbi:MAG: glutathione synthase [Pseudomonadota bacterium]|nr:glutathione synthase [Pseudomonadota bacterium]
MFKFGIVMDSIHSINPQWDSTFALMLALQKKCLVEYIKPHTMHLEDTKVFAHSSLIRLSRSKKKYFLISKSRKVNLNSFDCILFRTNPPVDADYIQTTYLLDQIENNGTLVINSPQSLRDFNEKILGTSFFKKKLPMMIVSDINMIKKFIRKHKKVVIKPLNLMAGKSISLLTDTDQNKEKIIKEVTNNGKTLVMIQKFIKEIIKGDTRIIIYNGIVYEKVLVRYPPKNEFRANLAYGGKFFVKNILDKHKNFLSEIGQYLKSNGIYLAGVDMIDEYITEINITSPSGIQEIDKETNYDLSKKITNEFIKVLKMYYSHEKKILPK